MVAPHARVLRGVAPGCGKHRAGAPEAGGAPAAARPGLPEAADAGRRVDPLNAVSRWPARRRTAPHRGPPGIGKVSAAG